jgi:hypothetical protein
LTKNELKLENIIKLLETYIPVKFNNINNEFINNRILNNDINNNITSNCNKKAFTNIILKFFKDNNIEIIILTDNNKLWFSYTNILKIIGYKNIKLQKSRINIDKKYFNTYKNIVNLSSNNVIDLNIQHHTKMINEEGLYLLLNKSTKSFSKNIIEKFYTET